MFPGRPIANRNNSPWEQYNAILVCTRVSFSKNKTNSGCSLLRIIFGRPTFSPNFSAFEFLSKLTVCHNHNSLFEIIAVLFENNSNNEDEILSNDKWLVLRKINKSCYLLWNFKNSCWITNYLHDTLEDSKLTNWNLYCILIKLKHFYLIIKTIKSVL